MNHWDNLSEEKKAEHRQLLQDMIPYYDRIAVYSIDKEFINANLEQCLRVAIAGKQVMLKHTELTPEEAIFSDTHFQALIGEAWNEEFSHEDKLFLNNNLQKAAECFRMGFMMADLPEF